MPIINLNKVIDFYIHSIRDELNFHEKIELSRLILNGIEHDNEMMLLKMRNEAKNNKTPDS